MEWKRRGEAHGPKEKKADEEKIERNAELKDEGHGISKQWMQSTRPSQLGAFLENQPKRKEEKDRKALGLKSEFKGKKGQIWKIKRKSQNRPIDFGPSPFSKC